MFDIGPSPSMDLSIIIVSWNVRDFLLRCIQALVQCLNGIPGDSPWSYEIIVVDNASSDGSCEAVKASYPWVIWVQNAGNLGFARANNQALRLSRGRYFLLLNPDTEVQAGSISRLIRYLEETPEVGMVGPKLLYPNGQIQSSRRRFPTFGTGFIESTIVQRWFPRHPLLRRYYMADCDDDETVEVAWLVGACLLVRRQACEQVGLLDERFFMYSEEMEFAARVSQAGWRIMYVPDATVMHHEARSSEQVAAHRLILFHSSKVAYYAMRFGRLRGQALRVFLLASICVEWLTEGGKWLLGHRRPLRRERMKAYCQVLRSGLRVSEGGPSASISARE